MDVLLHGQFKKVHATLGTIILTVRYFEVGNQVWSRQTYCDVYTLCIHYIIILNAIYI